MKLNLIFRMEIFLLVASTLTAELVAMEMKILSETQLEVIEGSKVNVSCRFNPKSMDKTNRLFWLKHEDGLVQEIAVGDEKRKRNCRIHLDREAGIYDLYITAVNYTFHNGLYQCILIDLEQRLELTRFINLTIFAIPSKPEIKPRGLLLNDEDNINLTCTSHRVFAGCNILWIKKQGSATNLLASSTDSSCLSNITFKAYKSDHRAELICRLTNRRLGSEYTGQDSLLVQIKHKPGKAIISPLEIKGVVGDKIRLQCSAIPLGFPPPVFRWTRGNSGKHLGTGASILLKLEIEVNEITCTASNEIGKGNLTSATVIVNMVPRITTYPKPVLEFPSGSENVTLVFKGSSKPKSQIEWTKDFIPLISIENVLTIETISYVDHKGVYETTSVLKFKTKMTGLKTGIYKCRFSNQLGTVYASTELRIKDVPRFVNTKQQEEIWADIGKEVTLDCRFHGYPRPDLKWITPPSSYNVKLKTVSNFQQQSMLTIKSVKQSDLIDFICEGSNKEGTSHLIFQVRPRYFKIPRNVTVLKSTSHSLTIQWDPDEDVEVKSVGAAEVEDKDFDFRPEFGSTPTSQPLEYKIKYRKQNDESETKVRETGCIIQIPCQIEHLSSGTEYILEVIPYRLTGIGNGTTFSVWTKNATVLNTSAEKSRQQPASFVWSVVSGFFLFLCVSLIVSVLYYKVSRGFLIRLIGVEIALGETRHLQIPLYSLRGIQNDIDVIEKGENDDDTITRTEEILQKLERPCTSATAIKLWSQIHPTSLETTIKPCDV